MSALVDLGRWAQASIIACRSVSIRTECAPSAPHFAVKSNQRANALEAAQEQLEHNLYASRISRAEQAWTNNDIVQTENILGECNPDVGTGGKYYFGW